jgi:hypothetical protein
MSYVMCGVSDEYVVVPIRSEGIELTRMGSLRPGDTGGEVLAEHWLIPYNTFGYPRTQVLALGAMHVDCVHGGALGSWPWTVKEPWEFTDIVREPGSSKAAPRFHSSAFS